MSRSAANLHARRVARPWLVLAVLAVLALASIGAFMLIGAQGNWDFVLPFRGRKLLGLILVAYAVAVSTVLFQAVTNNRILTPAMMGFDWLYILIQTSMVFFFGSRILIDVDPQWQFMLQVVVMAMFSCLLFQWLFVSGNRSLHLLVLVGIVFGILFRSLAMFMQRLLDPNEFLVLQDSFFASFNTIDQTMLWISCAVIGVASVLGFRLLGRLDVLSLGRDRAVSLGLPYKATVIAILILMAVLVSVSTALVGPVTFFGLLVVSLAHAAIGNGRHRFILPASILIAIVCLVGGQTVLERVFAFNTALSIIIEFLGGIVFILLILRGAARR